MQRLHSSLAEARNAAVHLQESLNRLHEGHHFRKDYQKFLESANSLLKQIEQTQHHAPEVVSLALRKLHTANGCLAKALREERGSSTPSLLGSIGSIGGLAPVHTDSFRTAERLLLEAIEELRNPGQIGDSNSSMQSYESQQPGTPVGAVEQRADPSFLSSITTTMAAGHQPAAEAPEQTGLLTQYTANLGSMLGSIGAMTMGPGPSGTVGNLCVAVNYTSYTQLDLYVGCREKQLKSYSLEKQQRCQGVKCMTYDPGSSTVWTGHADGSIKVHRIKSAATEAAAECSLASDTCRHGVAVTSLVIEAQDSPGAQPRCWAGDAEGRVCVRKLATLQNGQLHLLVNATVAPWENQPRPPKYLPVGAMLQLGTQMLVSGGCVREGADPAHRLQLWDCKKMKSLRDFACRCGPVTCLELLSDVLQPPSAIESVTSWRSSISEGDMGSGSCSVAYKLLSGHADGQVVLWELTGRGAAPELRELAVIGEYSKDRVVKSIFAFPQWDMLVVATSSSGIRNLGKLRVMHLPSPAELEQAESKRRQATAAPHRNAQPTVDLKVYVHEAHTQKILATAHLGESIVTASTSSIKFWSPRQLALYAAKGGPRVGLTFNRISTICSAGSRRLSDPAGLTEALTSKSSSDHQSPFVRTQQQQSQPQTAQAQVPTSPQAARVVEQASQARPMDIPVGPPSMQSRASRAHEFVRVVPEGTPPSYSQAGSAPSTQGSYPCSFAGSHPGSYGAGWMNPAAASQAAAGSPAVPPILALGAPGAPFGPFGAAAAGGMRPSSSVAQGWAGAAPTSSAQGPMSPVPVPFGVSPQPISPVMAGGVPPWQSAAPTRPLSPAQWQQQQQELAMQQQQEALQRQQQEALQRQQQEKLQEQRRLQQLRQRMQPLISPPSTQRAMDAAGSALLKGNVSAAAARPAAAPRIPSPRKVNPFASATVKAPSGQRVSFEKSPAAAAAAAAGGSSSSTWSASEDARGASSSSALSALSDIMPADPIKPSKQQQQQGMQEGSSDAVAKVQAVEQAQAEQLQLQKQEEVDAPARAQAEVAAHCGYQFVRQLPDQTMFGSSRALQVRCSRTNRLRTLLQVPRSELRQLAADGTAFGDFKEQLVDASKVHHPHMLQVQEVFVGPMHLNIVLEECSAGRLLDYPAKQASAWGSGPGAAAAAALSPEFARWFFQQAVLAVHYYHSLFGSAEHRSKLSMMNTLLKIAPTLPQPVVKVPSTILARGISAFTLTGSPSVSKPGEDPFIPPEVYDSRGARGDTPAGDVWACGVLLLKLLGGHLKDSVHPKPGSSSGAGSSSQGVSGVLFDFPAQQDSSVDEATRELLSRMLKRQPQERITLERLRDHPWFLKGLPPNAHSMTDRFLKASRACRQSEDELRAAVDAAGAGADAPMQLLQQVKQHHQRQHKAPKAMQSVQKPQSAQQPGKTALKQQLQVELLQGPVTPELQHGLQLQLHTLRHACLQLYGVSTAAQQGGTSSSSVSRLTELMAAQQAAASAVSTFTAMDAAARALQQHSRLLRATLAPLSHTKRPPDRTLGMAQLLQLACTDALFRISRLQQLLLGTTEPSRWAQLQASVPVKGFACCSQAGAAGKADPVAWERTLHLLKVQAFLLEQAHGVLHSLWVCRAAAAAVSRACLGRKRAAAHGPGAKPLMLTAVLGPDALAAVVVSAALQLQQPAAGAKLWQRQGVLYRSAAVSMLMLVHLNEARHSQQQQWQRGQVRVQSVSRLEDIDSILVSKAPLENQHSYSGCGSGCTVYEGQQGGQKMLVVALSQLFAPDTTAAPDLPPKRREVREQLQLQGSSTLMEKTIQCPICLGVMKDPVNASDQYAYCRACIQTHFNTQKAQGRTVVSPSTLKPMPDTVLTDSNHLRGSVSHWETVRQQELKLVQARVAQQLKQQQLAWTGADPSQEFKAAEHLGLAHAAQAGSADAVHTLQQVLMRLNDAKLLAGSNSASTSSSSQQVLPLLAPIHCMCSDPPLLVMPKPQGGTLEQWIAATAASLSVDKVGGKDFTLAWVQQVSWPVGLQLLSDVAAALCALHQQQPAVVLGGVHAAAVHLPQPLPDASSAQQQQLGAPGGARVSQLSLVALLSQLAPLSSCHPFLAAPETLLASGPASPAADVYGFGVLMFQLATGWLPQQYTAGTDKQIAAVMWCRDMMAQAGSTSALAAAQALAKLPADSGSAPPLPTGEWTPYGRHLPSVAALQQLPAGYVTLMEQCLQRVAPARPCVHELSARLADMTAAGQGRAGSAGQSVMIEAMRAVEKRRAAGVTHAPTPLVVPRGYEPSQVSPTRC